MTFGTQEGQLATRETHLRVVKIIEILHGLPIQQANFLLSETARLLAMTTSVDVTGVLHRELIDYHNKLFNDGLAAPQRQ